MPLPLHFQVRCQFIRMQSPSHLLALGHFVAIKGNAVAKKCAFMNGFYFYQNNGVVWQTPHTAVFSWLSLCPSGTSRRWSFLTSVLVTPNTVSVVYFWIFSSK